MHFVAVVSFPNAITMWTCPNCGRSFKNPNQSHSCVVVKPEELLRKSSDHVVFIYRKLDAEVRKLGKVQVNCSKSTINYTYNSTFLVLKPKKERMDLEFLLDNEVNEFPINKTFRVSRHRVGHCVSLEDVAEIDRQLLAWIKQAYLVVKS
jgi:Domain of unknown function (DUF5655)